MVQNKDSRKKNKLGFYIAVFLVIIALIFLIMFQAGVMTPGKIVPGNTKVPAEQKIPEKEFQVKATDIPSFYTSIGTVQSRDEIEISPRITARIIEVPVRSGDSVKKNEVVVKLDDSDLEALAEEAKERLRGAIARLEPAVKQYRREETLFKKQAAAEKDLDIAQENYKTALADVAAARQSVRQALANLSYTEIRSPMNGIVADRFDDPGDLASPSNIIMKIFDPSRLMLYVPIRESLVKMVKVGDKVSFHVEALQKTYTGEVREIVPSVDTGSRTFLIKICIDGSNHELMPGMFGTFRLKTGTEKAILIPRSAISRVGQLEYVSMKSSDNSTKRVIVRTVPSDEKGMLKVVSGLENGDTILVGTPSK